MKVFHVIKTLAQEYGGPARSVQGLVAALEAVGVETWLVSLEDGGTPYVKGIRHFKTLSGSLLETKNNMQSLITELKPNLIHTHDLWMPKLHLCHVAARLSGVPYVISPRGTLEAWSLQQKWLKKQIALHTYEGYDLRHALAVHATVEEEAVRCRMFCGTTPIIVCPNGVNVPESLPLRIPHTKKDVHRVLFLSRMHPKKGVCNLLRAWEKVRPKGWCCEFVYSLNDDLERRYEKESIVLAHELGIAESVVFSGAVNDAKKWTKYSNADLFILPTFSENFGIVVAEALWAGVPVVTTKGAPWQELETRRCGWWIDVGVDPLADALRKATGLSDAERREMGMRGRKLVEEKYQWPAIGRQMLTAYERLMKILK